MRDIKPPPVSDGHPDRNLECQVALSDAFAELADKAIAVGWPEEEVAAALPALADNRMLGAAQIAKINDLLSSLKRR
ncbi:hypothetical protein [Rhizobium lusitanum]|uniref:Uncharacterized protein n=1 Tax=Rhizobium lusitanum TaxID=293958 RepID=A0A7X0IRM6_9HYPH|nr:hypothetical protein [Rhizobium lusitanum]MBB6484426.1 hypothetical protein [Rhizobium lusitanum]